MRLPFSGAVRMKPRSKIGEQDDLRPSKRVINNAGEGAEAENRENSSRGQKVKYLLPIQRNQTRVARCVAKV